MTAIGDPNLCSAQCSVDEGQSVQDLGECLSERVDVVVCRVVAGGNATVGGSSSSSATGSQSRTSASMSASASTSQSGSAAPSTGAGNALGVAHVGGGKKGIVVFGMLAVGSFVGMML